MTIVTIMFMLSNYWKKILLDGNNLVLFVIFTDIYILLYMYHDFTFDVVTVIITDLPQ